MAESFADGDRHPPTFDPDTHVVSLPEPFKKSLQRVARRRVVPGRARRRRRRCAGTVDGAMGDQRVRPRRQPAGVHVSWPVRFWPTSSTRIGNEQQRHWASLAIDRNWGATMVLTEPDAGSDVGAGRTKAIDQGDGTWHIEGVKRFITNGDTDDLFENILHMVLARPEGAGPGHQGPEPVPGAQVPARPADRRTGRAQRGVRHRAGTQDGPEGFGHLRTDVRRARSPCEQAGWSATATTASRRCSRSSNMRE